MQSPVAVQAALSSDILRSNSLRFTTNVELYQEDSDSDNDDDVMRGSGGCGNRPTTLRELGRKVIRANSQEQGVHTRMVLESALQKLDRRRDKEHGVFISEVLGNAALMAKTTKALRSVRDPLFSEKDLDRTALFNVITRVLHEMKVTVASTCWDQTVLPCKEELNDQHVKYESMRRVFQDSREAYLKEVAALRDQVRMRGDLGRLDDDNMPSMDIVSYFDPEYVMLPGEQKFLLDAVKEKIRMMIERNPKLESCIDFGQLDRLQNRVESNDLQETKKALKHALAKLKEAENTIAKKSTKEDSAGKGAAAAPSASASEKVIEALEEQMQKLREKLSCEEIALKSAKRNILTLEGEKDDLSQSLRNLSTEQVVHKTELNRLQERLSQYEPLARDAEAEIARLQDLVQSQETQIKKLSGQVHEDIQFHHESLLSQADEAAGTRREEASDKVEQEKLNRVQDERDVALARCDDLSKKCEQMRAAVRCEVEHFLGLKSAAILEGADSMMEQAELLGCMSMEGVSDGACVCECGNVLAQDSLFCRKCGTKWQKAATCAKELCVSKDTLVALTLQLNNADQKLDAAKMELREALESQEGQPHDDIDDDVEWLEKLMRIQSEVDTHQRQKLRLEAMILEARVRLTNRAALEMPNSENDHCCTCSCSEELRATRKLLERTQLLCTESTSSLQRVARENSAASATLNKMQDTLDKAAGATESIAADGPDMRLVLKALHEARVQAVFNRLYENRHESSHKASKDARNNRMMEDAFKGIYQLDDNEKDKHAGLSSPLLSLEKHTLAKFAPVVPKCRTEVRKQTGKKILVLATNHLHPEAESRVSDTRSSTPEGHCHLRRTPTSGLHSARSSAANTRCNSPEEPMLRVTALPPLRGQPCAGQQPTKYQSAPCSGGGQRPGVVIVPPEGRPNTTGKFQRKRTCPV